MKKGDTPAWFYATQNREIIGPIPESELLDLVSKKRISPQALVWRQGLSDWVMFKTIPSLQNLSTLNEREAEESEEVSEKSTLLRETKSKPEPKSPGFFASMFKPKPNESKSKPNESKPKPKQASQGPRKTLLTIFTVVLLFDIIFIFSSTQIHRHTKDIAQRSQELAGNLTAHVEKLLYTEEAYRKIAPEVQFDIKSNRTMTKVAANLRIWTNDVRTLSDGHYLIPYAFSINWKDGNQDANENPFHLAASFPFIISPIFTTSSSVFGLVATLFHNKWIGALSSGLHIKAAITAGVVLAMHWHLHSNLNDKLCSIDPNGLVMPYGLAHAIGEVDVPEARFTLSCKERNLTTFASEMEPLIKRYESVDPESKEGEALDALFKAHRQIVGCMQGKKVSAFVGIEICGSNPDFGVSLGSPEPAANDDRPPSVSSELSFFEKIFFWVPFVLPNSKPLRWWIGCISVSAGVLVLASIVGIFAGLYGWGWELPHLSKS